MRTDLTMFLIFHTAKNIGIDEKSLSLFKVPLLTCCQQTHTALPDIDKFYLLVPVPGNIITAIFVAVILLCVLEEGMKNGNI